VVGKIRYLKEVYTLLGTDKNKLPGVLFLLIMAAILDMIGVGMIGPYIGFIINPEEFFIKISFFSDILLLLPENNLDIIIIFSSILFSVFVVKGVISIYLNYVINRFGMDQQVRLKSELMLRYQNLLYEDYLHNNSADYIYNIQILVTHYTRVVMTLLKIASDGLVTILLIILLGIVDITTLLGMITLFLIVLVPYDYFFRKELTKIGKLTNTAANNMIKGINEGIEGLKDLRILGKSEYFYNVVNNSAKDVGRYFVKSSIITQSTRYIFEVVVVLFIVINVLYAYWVVVDINEVMAILAMFGVASVRLLPSISLLSSGITQLRFYRDSVSKLNSNVNKYSIGNLSGNTNSTSIGKTIFDELVVKDVSYSFPHKKREKVILNVNMNIKNGEAIGIIGTSGSGKSTLIDLILGLLKPEKGAIYINGKTLDSVKEKWWNNIAYIPQEVFLIDDSIKKNVAIGTEDCDIDNKRVIDSLQKARLSSLLCSLPDGVNEFIGERGVRLSGGQRQRIALARAFYYDRDVLIMDEATSALDNDTEKEIINEINLLKGEKTMIVIAHRLSTVEHCDRIYKIENGGIVVSGSLHEVINYEV
jgi:ATP-binding cassette, subfamily B, bacterial PglK